MELVSLWDDSAAELATPEQVDLRLELANVGSRGLALLIDMGIRYGVIFLLYLIGLLAHVFAFGRGDLDPASTGFLVLFLLILFASEWVYFTVFEWWWNGQTPGKRLLHLRVIKADGSPVGVLEVFLRNLLRPIDTSGPMALIGMAFIFFTRKSQRPGDLAARTIVVREAAIDWSLFDALDENENEPVRSRVMLSPAEWELLQRYLQRADRLDPASRTRLAAKVKQALASGARGTDLADSDLPPERWLREVVRRV